MRWIRQGWRDESAVTAIEYAIVAGAIAVTVVAAVGALGQAIPPLLEKLLPGL